MSDNRLVVIDDNDSSKMWLTDRDWKQSNWPMRFAIRLTYTEAYDEEWTKQVGKYHFEVIAVSSKAAGKKIWQKAADSWGNDLDWFVGLSMEAKCQVLIEYGTAAVLFQASGNNQAKLFKECKAKLTEIQFLFGFYMDRPLNAVGDTGWDWIKGDLGAGMRRYRRQLRIDKAAEDLARQLGRGGHLPTLPGQTDPQLSPPPSGQGPGEAGSLFLRRFYGWPW
jgi:hypothetical protein